MRSVVTVDGHTFQIEIVDDQITIDGERVEANLAGTGTLRHLILNGQSHTMLATETEQPGRWQIDLEGHRFLVEVVDERSHALRSVGQVASATQKARSVRAPMPGMIVRVEVAEGQEVRAGQGVVIIEAMKMENELRADGGGIVSRVLVQPGQPVEKGTVLIEFQNA